MIGSVALTSVLGLAVQAQTNEATITVPVEVRSGPSDKFYPTSKLLPGDKVQIVDDKQVPWLAGKMPPSGWLAIKPPRDSFSWINQRFLNTTSPASPVGQVLGDDVPVRTGSTLYNGRPYVEWVKLQRGAQVIIVGKKEDDAIDNSVWIPIAPAPQEVRFIPADAVKGTMPVQTVSSAPPPTPPLAPGAPIPASPSAPIAPGPEEPLWVQAKKAEQEGRLDDAKRLYQQLADQTANHDLRLNCLNQIHFINQGKSGGIPPVQPSSPTPAGAPGRVAPTPAYPYGPTVTTYPGAPNQATSQYTYEREGTAPPTSQAPPAGSWTGPGGTPTASASRGPGWLKRSNSLVGGKPAYLLDLGQGQAVLFVVPQAGVYLEPYVDRRVSLRGSVGYHAGYRQEYITAEQVTLAP
jgi:hypothetical protein